MSTATNIEHERAAWAWKQVEGVHPNIQDGYRVITKTVPAMINQSGLLAALAYLDTRTGSNKEAAKQALVHLTDWLVVTDPQRGGALNGDRLLPELAGANTELHRQRTDEVMAILGWLRRFADVQSRSN